MSARLQEQQRQQAIQPNDKATSVATGPSGPDDVLTTGDTRAAFTRGPFPDLTNRAGESDSPYVRLHANTPVAWQLLDDATLQRATAENKPIFMHIGFLADHREFALYYLYEKTSLLTTH